jgi:hypothetical protein
MLRLLMALVVTFSVTIASSAQQVIHYWNFNNPASSAPVWPQPLSATSGAGVLTYTFPSHVVSFAGTTINAQGGDPNGNSFVVQNGTDNINEGKHFELHVPTTGFESIVLAYATQRTTTGFRSQAFSYSLDGVTYVPFATITDIPGSFALRTVNFSSIAGAADNPEFRVRVTLTGGDTGQTSGNNRFDNITVSGIPRGDDPVFTRVLIPQIIRVGEPFHFSYEATHPDGLSISYSLVGGPAGASIDEATGDFEWTPSLDRDALRTSVTVRASAGPFSAETSAIIVPVAYDTGAPTRDLYFSKYIWGGSFNKAVEIFNGTGADVDLGQYTLEVYFNAGTTPQRLPLSGILAHGDAAVYAHPSADPRILEAARATWSQINFNGDDAVVLRTATRVADVIGYVGEPRVSVWGTGQLTTGQNSLWRRPDACRGLTDTFYYSYHPASYFVSFPSGTYESLGIHSDSCDEPVPNNPPQFVASLSTKFIDAGTTLVREIVATDPDGDEVRYLITGSPEGASFDAQTGVFSWTAATPGVYTVTFIATDGFADASSTATIGVRGTICPDLEAAALRACLRDGYSPSLTLGYDLARDIMYTVINREEDNFVRGIYTGFAVEMVDDPSRTPRQIMGQGGINAEHVWPQSKGADSEPARSDLHNLFPSNAGANSSRSNWPYAYVPAADATSWWGSEGRIDPAPTSDFELYSRYGGQKFEPRDYAKGPVARAGLYFFSIFESQADRAFALVQRDVLEEWGQRDVDLWELKRTGAIAQYQGNFNPFLVDHTLPGRALTDVVPPFMPIAEARALPVGSLVQTTGIVTRSAGRYTRFEDAEAGLTIFQAFGPVASAVASGEIAPGDEILVLGTMAVFNGLVQISVDAFEVVSRGNPLPEPIRLTLADIASNGVAYESRLIEVDGLSFQEAAGSEFVADRTYRVRDVETDFLVVDLRTQRAGDGSIVGSRLLPCLATFEGVLGRFSSTFQLQPVDASDVTFNCSPVELSAITLPGDPVLMGTEVTASTSVLNAIQGAGYQAIINWGDGTIAEGTVEGTVISAKHTYAAPGVYTVRLDVTGDFQGQGTAFFRYVVVYDPDGGFVTGSGWIDSPAGAYVIRPDLSGRANFGFVSRYQRGAHVPSGNTQFQFQAGSLSFRSTDYEWLVISGSRAQYKGSGRINGAGDFGFMLTAVDGDAQGSQKEDRFRIRIWDKDAGTTVYDNQLGEGCSGIEDDAVPCGILGGGSIVVHAGSTTGGNLKTMGIADEPGLEAPTEFALHANYPNPFNPTTMIRFDLKEAVAVRLSVYDALGREVTRLVDGNLPAGRHQAEWRADGLPSGVYLFRLEAGSFVKTGRMTLVK